MVTIAACKDIDLEGKPGKYQIGVSWPVVVQILALALAVRWRQVKSGLCGSRTKTSEFNVSAGGFPLFMGGAEQSVPVGENGPIRAEVHYFLGKNAD